MKNKPLKSLLLLIVFAFLFSNCAIIRQGEVGVKRKLGKINQNVLYEGPKSFNPLTTVILRVPTRTVNLEISASLPSKEGLSIRSEISILYRIKAQQAPRVLQEVGRNYEQEVILPVFRSAAADVTARFFAKDMHSGERGIIEKAIREQMMEILEDKGFIIENVLMKSIQLPAGLAQSIEAKLEAEQDAQRLEFVKQQDKVDAERRLIQAEGEKNAQIIAAEGRKQIAVIEAEGRANALKLEAEAQNQANEVLRQNLTAPLLRLRSIEAFRELSGSENSKILISDGKSPLLGLPGSFLE